MLFNAPVKILRLMVLIPLVVFGLVFVNIMAACSPEIEDESPVTSAPTSVPEIVTDPTPDPTPEPVMTPSTTLVTPEPNPVPTTPPPAPAAPEAPRTVFGNGDWLVNADVAPGVYRFGVEDSIIPLCSVFIQDAAGEYIDMMTANEGQVIATIPAEAFKVSISGCTDAEKVG